jgi:hypothetical protein
MCQRHCQWMSNWDVHLFEYSTVRRSKIVGFFYTRPSRGFRSEAIHNCSRSTPETYQMALRNDFNLSWSLGSKEYFCFGSTRTPAWNRPRPKITELCTIGCLLMIVSVVGEMGFQLLVHTLLTHRNWIGLYRFMKMRYKSLDCSLLPFLP